MWLAILDIIGYHIHLYVEMAPNLRVITSLKQKTMTQAVHTPIHNKTLIHTQTQVI